MNYLNLILVVAGLVGSVIPASAEIEESFAMTCDYNYYGSPFVQIKTYSNAGVFQSPVEITHYGKTTTETLTEETVEVGELYRFTISKESPENWLSMIVYPDHTSKLINSHIPVGKEMKGNCVLTNESFSKE